MKVIDIKVLREKEFLSPESLEFINNYLMSQQIAPRNNKANQPCRKSCTPTTHVSKASIVKMYVEINE